MWNIKYIETLYSERVDSVIKMDCSMGLFHNSSDVTLMCKEMLGCMQFYFRNIYYVEVEERNQATGVYFHPFNSDADSYTDQEKGNQYLNYQEGWHTLVLNASEMTNFRGRLHQLVGNDALYEGTVLEQYKERRHELAEILFQYGLMHIFYHEYGHVVNGHKLAEYHGQIEMTNQLQRALEYNADIFAVNQICYRMMSDYDLFGKYAKEGEGRYQAILNEFPLMLLGSYIYLDGFYMRERMMPSDYQDWIASDSTHMPPFIRQQYLLCQFAGIWTNPKYSGYQNLDVNVFNNEALCYLDAYERAVYGTGIEDAPFRLGEGTMGMMAVSQAQQCWNEYYTRLEPYISPKVQLSEYSVLNVAEKRYME